MKYAFDQRDVSVIAYPRDSIPEIKGDNGGVFGPWRGRRCLVRGINTRIDLGMILLCIFFCAVFCYELCHGDFFSLFGLEFLDWLSTAVNAQTMNISNL